MPQRTLERRYTSPELTDRPSDARDERRLRLLHTLHDLGIMPYMSDDVQAYMDGLYHRTYPRWYRITRHAPAVGDYFFETKFKTAPLLILCVVFLAIAIGLRSPVMLGLSVISAIPFAICYYASKFLNGRILKHPGEWIKEDFTADTIHQMTTRIPFEIRTDVGLISARVPEASFRVLTFVQNEQIIDPLLAVILDGQVDFIHVWDEDTFTGQR